jgi:hypothetical protein
MLLEQTNYWTRIEAYVVHPPSRWRLLLARAEWLRLEWQAGAKARRDAREIARLRDASAYMPAHLRRDIGIM